MKTNYEWSGTFSNDEYVVEFSARGYHWHYPQTWETPEEDEWEVEKIELYSVTQDGADVILQRDQRSELEDLIKKAIINGEYTGEVLSREA